MTITIYQEWNNDTKSLAKQCRILEKELADLRFFVNEYIENREERKFINKEMGFK
jgi:hypothetical protein